jgi:hypothetical protein
MAKAWVARNNTFGSPVEGSFPKMLGGGSPKEFRVEMDGTCYSSSR